jgi:hypothetical protein
VTASSFDDTTLVFDLPSLYDNLVLTSDAQTARLSVVVGGVETSQQLAFRFESIVYARSPLSLKTHPETLLASPSLSLSLHRCRYYEVRTVTPDTDTFHSIGLCVTNITVFGTGFLTYGDYLTNFSAHDASKTFPTPQLLLGDIQDEYLFSNKYKQLKCEALDSYTLNCPNTEGCCYMC